MNTREYSIGVVTYHARFANYFMPLIEKLAVIFPDREIICVVNGHPDRTLQINYLNSVTAFMKRFRNVRYLTYDLNQSLSKCWNQLVILSQTEKMLIMNDDTQVSELFRTEFEEKVALKDFSTMNTSWSHFLISKNIVRKAGWFEERLLGVGQEDLDYGLRMIMNGIPVTNTNVLGLNNYVIDEENPGWQDVSKKAPKSKYAQVNLEFFKAKWAMPDTDPTMKPAEFIYEGTWGHSTVRFAPKMQDVSLPFYDFSVLSHKNTTSVNFAAYHANRLNMGMEKIFFAGVRVLKTLFKKIVS